MRKSILPVVVLAAVAFSPMAMAGDSVYTPPAVTYYKPDASHAQRADSAGYATSANHANTANRASWATNADVAHGGSVDYARTAGTASSAGYATRAGSAPAATDPRAVSGSYTTDGRGARCPWGGSHTYERIRKHYLRLRDGSSVYIGSEVLRGCGEFNGGG